MKNFQICAAALICWVSCKQPQEGHRTQTLSRAAPHPQTLTLNPVGTEPSTSCIVNGIYHMPNPVWTPGWLCSEGDPDFSGYRYKTRVAYCTRHTTIAEKDRVAARYGIPKSDYHLYEFDHLIPLNSGGSNDDRNLWPQPLTDVDAYAKDKVEMEAYTGLNSGTLTQDQAVAKIRAWRSSVCR